MLMRHPKLRPCCRLWLSRQVCRWASQKPNLLASRCLLRLALCCLRLHPREHLRFARLGPRARLSRRWQAMGSHPGWHWTYWKGVQRQRMPLQLA